MTEGTIKLVCTAPVVVEGLTRVLGDMGWATTTDPAETEHCGTVIFVRTARGIAEVVAAVGANEGLPIVALIDDDQADLTADLVDAGATSVISWDSPAEVVSAALSLALSGYSTISTGTLRWIAAAGSRNPLITDAERRWLEHLAAGITIADLAPLAGYSERSLYRQLNGLYHRLGVDSRAGAIAEARRRGVLD